MRKTLLTTLAMAAALCAQAETIELITNGAGSNLLGWESDGFQVYDQLIEDGNQMPMIRSWFMANANEAVMSQTITLADFGLTPAMVNTLNPEVRGTWTILSEDDCAFKITVYSLESHGLPIEANELLSMNQAGVEFENEEFRFNIPEGAVSLKYEIKVTYMENPGSEGSPKFRNLSMTYERNTVNIDFVSSGKLMGSAEYVVGDTPILAALRPPIALRNENYRFLGYFTEETGGTKVYDANYDFVTASSWNPTSNVTVYAQWKPAPSKHKGDVTQFVYRGVLTNFGEWTSALNKTMHVKVYESASASTPLWSGSVANVPINPDGSFEAVFENDELALAFASNDVTHVELTVGDSLSPLAPRRALASVASVNRALVAEGAASDIKVGTLGANAIVAESVTARSLEASETVRVEGSLSVKVMPFDVDLGQETTIWRGAGVTAWGDSQRVATASGVFAGQLLWKADREGVAMIHATGTSRSTLRIPATIQFVRPGDEVRAPTWENGEVSVTVWGYRK